MKRKSVLKKASGVRLTHPLVGTWAQEENSVDRTSAVFTVAVKDGRFLISGVDESDRTAFKISNITWDGACLRFVSLFPPTNHRAKHVFRLLGKDRVSHKVSYSDEGGTFNDDERWKKRPHDWKPLC
jgi:hypothetical protein